MAAAVLLADLAARGLKEAIGRERPAARYPEPEPLVDVPDSPSFPSGHASTSFACAAVLAWALPRFAVPLYLLAAAVAFSRIYAGVHYPLDAAGGAVLGLAVAAALRGLRATALRWLVVSLRRSRQAPPAG